MDTEPEASSTVTGTNGDVEKENENGLVIVEVEEEEEDVVSQVLTMLNFSGDIFASTHSTRKVACEEEIEEGACVARMFERLENSSLVAEKEKEVEELVGKLEAEKKERIESEQKLSKIVEFISFVHGEFAKFMKCIISIARKNLEVNDVLSLGPFKDEKEVDEFLEMLNALSNQFAAEFENLGRTKSLLERVNLILAASAGISNNSGANEEENTNVRSSTSTYDSVEEDPETEKVDSPDNTEVTEVRAPVETPTSLSLESRNTEKGKRKWKKTDKRYLKSLRSFQKPHGIDYSRRHRGHFCLCGIKLRKHVYLKNHVKYFTTERKFPCEICNKRFLFACALRRHMSIKHNIVDLSSAQFTCSKCGEEFEFRSGLFTHYRRFHATNNFQGRKLKQSAPVRFPATKWGRGVGVRNREKSSMENAIHGIDRTTNLHRCICGVVYSHSSSLFNHVRGKLNGKVFKCYLCTRRFELHVQLKLHVRNKHKEEYTGGRFGCSTCGQTMFETFEELRAHRSIFHGIDNRRQRRFNKQGMTANSNDMNSQSSGPLANDPPPVLSPPHVQIDASSDSQDEIEDDDVICID